jgi:hypothetical protein
VQQRWWKVPKSLNFFPRVQIFASVEFKDTNVKITAQLFAEKNLDDKFVLKVWMKHGKVGRVQAAPDEFF